jgi:hypothetical protein
MAQASSSLLSMSLIMRFILLIYSKQAFMFAAIGKPAFFSCRPLFSWRLDLARRTLYTVAAVSPPLLP